MKLTVRVQSVSWVGQALVVTDSEECQYNLGKPGFEVKVGSSLKLDVDGRKLRGSERSTPVEVTSAAPADESSPTSSTPASATPAAPAGTRDHGRKG